MNVDPFLIWLESTALSDWVVESPSVAFGFPGILVLHAIGMGFAVGISAALDLRILGVAPAVPMEQFRRYLPILWAGFWLNAVSGLLLLVGYPTKALTNEVFYLKLVLIAAAMTILVRLDRMIVAGVTAASERRMRRLAVVSLACWAGAITAGRLLAYTYNRMRATDF